MTPDTFIRIVREVCGGIVACKFAGVTQIEITLPNYEEIQKTFLAHNIPFNFTWDQFITIWPLKLNRVFVLKTKKQNNTNNANSVKEVIEDAIETEVSSLANGIYYMYCASTMLEDFIGTPGFEKMLPTAALVLHKLMKNDYISLSPEKQKRVMEQVNQLNRASPQVKLEASFGTLEDALVAVDPSVIEFTPSNGDGVYTGGGQFGMSRLAGVAVLLASLLQPTEAGWGWGAAATASPTPAPTVAPTAVPTADLAPSTYTLQGNGSVGASFVGNTTYTILSSVEPDLAVWTEAPGQGQAVAPSLNYSGMRRAPSESRQVSPFVRNLQGTVVSTSGVPVVTGMNRRVSVLPGLVGQYLEAQGIQIPPEKMLVPALLLAGKAPKCGDSCHLTTWTKVIGTRNTPFAVTPFFKPQENEASSAIRRFTKKEMEKITVKQPAFGHASDVISSAELFETFFYHSDSRIRFESGGIGKAIPAEKKTFEIPANDGRVDTALVDIANNEQGYLLGNITFVFDGPSDVDKVVAPESSALKSFWSAVSQSASSVITMFDTPTASDIKIPKLSGWAVEFFKKNATSGNYDLAFITYIRSDQQSIFNPLARSFIMTHRPSLSTALANFAIAPETLNIRTVGFLGARPYTFKETAPGSLKTFMDITRDFTIANLEAEIASSADSLLQRAEEYQTHGDAQISAVARHIVAHGSVMTSQLSNAFTGLTGQASVDKLTEIYMNTISLSPNISAESKNTLSSQFIAGIANVTAEILDPAKKTARMFLNLGQSFGAVADSLGQGGASGIKSIGDMLAAWAILGPTAVLSSLVLTLLADNMGAIFGGQGSSALRDIFNGVNSLKELFATLFRFPSALQAVAGAAGVSFLPGLFLSVNTIEQTKHLMVMAYVVVFLSIKFGPKQKIALASALEACRKFFLPTDAEKYAALRKQQAKNILLRSAANAELAAAQAAAAAAVAAAQGPAAAVAAAQGPAAVVPGGARLCRGPPPPANGGRRRKHQTRKHKKSKGHKQAHRRTRKR